MLKDCKKCRYRWPDDTCRIGTAQPIYVGVTVDGASSINVWVIEAHVDWKFPQAPGDGCGAGNGLS